MSAKDVIDGQYDSAVHVIKVASLREADCITAIEQATDLIVACESKDMHKHYSDTGALFVRFVHPRGAMYDDKFYAHVRKKCPGAVPALEKLIKKYTNEPLA